MGQFKEKKKAILEQAVAQGKKKTFNEQQFNELGTALLNEPSYTVEVTSTEKGEKVVKTVSPVADFRNSVIGQVAKAAGADSAEQSKLKSEMLFSTVPMHGFISEVISEYLDAGKRFSFLPKEDQKASLIQENVAATTKTTKNPKTQEEGTLTTGAYRKVKADSACPEHLKVRSK